MTLRRLVFAVVAVAMLAAPSVQALNPGYEHFVAAAGRGPGAEGSFWVTDLYAFNPNEFPVDVEIYWLWRDQDNSMAEPVEVTIPALTSVTVPDIISSVFGQEQAYGGFRIVGLNGLVAGSTYIYDRNGPYGQAFEAVPVEGALYAVEGTLRFSTLSFTQIFGIAENADFRTNFVGVGIDPNGTTFDLRVVDGSGAVVLAVDGVTLGAWEPKLWPLADLGVTGLNGGYIQVKVTSGAAIFAGSKISNVTNDAHTLEQWVLLGN